MLLSELNDDDRYSVDGCRGIAFYFYGPETKPNEDTEWTGEEEQTGLALMVMVGDDRKHAIDPEDIEPLEDGAYCPECGQIGCNAYAMGDEDA